MRYTVTFSGGLFWIVDTQTGARGSFYSDWGDANKEADRLNTRER